MSVPGPALRLALAYAPRAARAALSALFALDARLGAIVAATREPLIGEMRLTWWRDQLEALDAGAVPAEPLLAELAEAVLPAGIRGVALAGLAEGWMALLAPLPLDDASLEVFARGRGGRLFALAATAVGREPDATVEAWGQGWALADFAAHCSDAGTAARAAAAGRLRLAGSPRGLPRTLGVLALAARDDGPLVFPRMIAFALTGR